MFRNPRFQGERFGYRSRPSLTLTREVWSMLVGIADAPNRTCAFSRVTHGGLAVGKITLHIANINMANVIMVIFVKQIATSRPCGWLVRRVNHQSTKYTHPMRQFCVAGLVRFCQSDGVAYAPVPRHQHMRLEWVFLHLLGLCLTHTTCGE